MGPGKSVHYEGVFTNQGCSLWEVSLYLGQHYSLKEKNQDKEIQRRIMAGWAAHAKHRDIFKSNLPVCLKRQVYNSCVLPAMTYGAETWTLTKQAQNKLAAGQTKMEGSMLNITYKDRKTNIWVRERTKVIDIINTVRKMKWSWAGHINRFKDDRWTSRVSTWRPYDKKRWHGRPAKRWRDDLDKYWTAHDMAEDSTRPGNLETACWGLHPTTGHNGCLMMMMMMMITWTEQHGHYGQVGIVKFTYINVNTREVAPLHYSWLRCCSLGGTDMHTNENEKLWHVEEVGFLSNFHGFGKYANRIFHMNKNSHWTSNINYIMNKNTKGGNKFFLLRTGVIRVTFLTSVKVTFRKLPLGVK